MTLMNDLTGLLGAMAALLTAGAAVIQAWRGPRG